MTIGFIGAGRMGRPMVARLVEAGHDVVALGRTAEARHDLEQLGAVAVHELADAGSQAEVVVLCLFTDEQLRQVCLDSRLLSSVPSGSTLAVHTTANPLTIDAIAAHARHIDVVDAPVSGGPHDAAAGKLTLFVGGADHAVARLQPVFACYGDPILHVGPRGAGEKVKLVNNALFAGNIGLLAAAVDLGERLGVPEASVLAALRSGSGASRVLDIVAASGSVEAFIAATAQFVGKDVAVVRGVAGELGTGLGVLDLVINSVSNEAFNNLDISAEV